MPSSSKKQHNFMEAIAHSPSFAKKAGVPQSVGKDFASADKGRKFSKGGDMKSDMKEDMAMDKKQDKAMIQKAFKQHDAQEHEGGKGTTLKLAKGGMSKAEKQAREMIAEMKMQASAKRAYDDADKTEPAPAMATPSAPPTPAMAPPPRPFMPQRPMPPSGGMPGMNKGGKVSSASRRGDGIAQRGKTRGSIC
jgi:hypothetical protein